MGKNYIFVFIVLQLKPSIFLRWECGTTQPLLQHIIDAASFEISLAVIITLKLWQLLYRQWGPQQKIRIRTLAVSPYISSVSNHEICENLVHVELLKGGSFSVPFPTCSNLAIYQFTRLTSKQPYISVTKEGSRGRQLLPHLKPRQQLKQSYLRVMAILSLGILAN